MNCATQKYAKERLLFTVTQKERGTQILPHPQPHMCGGEMKRGSRKEGQPAASSVLRSPQGKQSGCRAS